MHSTETPVGAKVFFWSTIKAINGAMTTTMLPAQPLLTLFRRIAQKFQQQKIKQQW